METREFYRRHLPHFHPESGKFHIVFRLEGSLPQELVQRLKQEREERERYLSGETNLQKRHELLLDYWKQYFENVKGHLIPQIEGQGIPHPKS